MCLTIARPYFLSLTHSASENNGMIFVLLIICFLGGAIVVNRRFLFGLGMFGLGVSFEIITIDPSYFKVHPYSSSFASKLHFQLYNPSLPIDFTILSEWLSASIYQHSLQCVLVLALALACLLCY